jgi:hypothetical protein
MKTKLFIVLFATALGAITTVGCNHNQNGENSGDNPTNSQPLAAVTNSMGSVNTPPLPGTNSVPMTNHP